jgi:hypothetical protein
MGQDRSVRLWEVATGRELANFHGHSGHVFAVAFHPDGRRILSGGIEGVVKVWDVLRSRPVVCRGHSESVTGAAFSRDGRLVATESDMWRWPRLGGATVQLRKKTKFHETWDADTGEQVPPPRLVSSRPSAHSRSGTAVTSPDGGGEDRQGDAPNVVRY